MVHLFLRQQLALLRCFLLHFRHGFTSCGQFGHSVLNEITDCRSFFLDRYLQPLQPPLEHFLVLFEDLCVRFDEGHVFRWDLNRNR